MEAAQCPACGVSRPDHLPCGSRSEYQLLCCAACGILFSDPMVPADNAWYEHSEIYSARHQWLKHVAVSSQRPRWEFNEALKVVGSGATALLDVGCGFGDFLFHARRAGCDVTGIDFSAACVEFARTELGIQSVFNCSLEQLASRCSGQLFDAITIFEVLEHTADPFEVLRSAKSLLRQGGQLCVSVPGYRRWPALFDPDVDFPPHHLTLWSEQGLERLLERAGFRVIKVSRKPLQAADLGLHIKWAIRRALKRRITTVPASEQQVYAATPTAKKIVARAVRRLAGGLLAIACVPLRVHRRAGGFTLFVHAENA
ncbi:MAG: class I SAM-dependent methyltransferase [Acidobacteriia bacterium]|nr:class I SAM-dependent methyltransferase [Terriglobia bacterium]